MIDKKAQIKQVLNWIEEQAISDMDDGKEAVGPLEQVKLALENWEKGFHEFQHQKASKN